MKNLLNNLFSMITNYRLIKNENYLNIINQFHNEPHLEEEFFIIFDKLSKIYNKKKIEETNYTAFSTVKNIINLGLKGSFVECGVFKGEKISYFLETLKLMNIYDRDIYVVDTFKGMTDSSNKDIQVISGTKMIKGDMLSSLDEVKNNIYKTEYPKDKIHFIEIDVRQQSNLKKQIKKDISLLRIDTDFYDSVYAILNSLYDNVVSNGFILHDDYGHWKGHFNACLDFYQKRGIQPLLIRTCRKERIEIKK